jgi:CheY-like chemotaxis protein
VLAQHLARSGFQVLVAANGAEALAILDSNVKIDALVSDLSMPGMDGLTLIRAAQERLPRLSAILLTGYASDGVSLAINGAINGSYSLLRKPVTGLQLVERVRVLLATQSNADT